MNVNDLDQLDELDPHAQERVVGGTDTLKLLARVSHIQAESAADELEGIADEQAKSGAGGSTQLMRRTFIW